MSKLDELGLSDEYEDKQPGLQQFISKPTQRKYQPFGGPMQQPVQQQPEPIDYGYEVEPSFDNVFNDDVDAFSQTKELLKYTSRDSSAYSQSAGLAKKRYDDFLENKFKPFYQEVDSLGTFKSDSADDYLKSIDEQYKSYKKASEEEDGFMGPSDRKKYAIQEMGKYANWNRPNGLRDQYLRLKSDYDSRQALADEYSAQKIALQDQLTSIPMSVRMDMEKQISARNRAPRSKKATDEMLDSYSWDSPIYDRKTGEIVNLDKVDPREKLDPIYDRKTGQASKSYDAQRQRLGAAIKGDIQGVLQKRDFTANERKLRDRGVMFSQDGLMDGRPLGLSRRDVDALDLDEMRKAGMKSYQGRPLEEVLNEIGGEERVNMAKVMQAVYAAKSASESAQIEFFKYAGGPKADEYKKKMESAKERVNKTLSLAQEFGLDNELFEQAETTGWFSALGNAFKRGMLMDDMADYTPDFLTNTLSQDEMQSFINAASEIEKLPTSSALQRYQKVKSDGALEAFGNLLFNNPLAIPEMFVESLSSFLPATFKWGLASAGVGAAAGAVKGSAGGAGGMLAGAAAGGSLGARAGWAAASFTLETSGTVLEGMQELGIDWKNPKVFAAAWNNEATRSAIVKRAVKKGIPIALMDGISAGMAGKMTGLRELGLNGGKIIDGASWSQNLRVASAAAPRFTKWQKTNNVLTEVGADSLLGTAGEFFGQAWSKEPGEAWDWDAIAAEGVIGIGPGFAGGFMEQMRNQSNDFTDAPIQYSEQRTTPDGTTGVINRAGFQATYNTFNSADGMTSAILNMAGIDDANMADEANAPKAMVVQDWIANMWLSNPDKMANLRVIVADRTPFADMDNEGSFEMDDDGNGVIYMNRNKLNQDPIAAFMHEAGHMARYSMFDNEELLDLYEGLSMDDKLTAFAEYYKRIPGKKFSQYDDVEQREIQKAYNKLSRSKGPLAVADEWFSFQFVRVLSGGKPDPSVKSDLQGWLQKYAYPFMQKYAGDEKVAGSKKDILNAKILAYMGRTPRGFDPNTPRFDNMPGSETDFSAPGIRAPKGANVLAGLTDAEGLNHLVQQIRRTHPGNPRLQLALAKDTNSFLDKNVLPTNISFWTKAERKAAEDVAEEEKGFEGFLRRNVKSVPDFPKDNNYKKGGFQGQPIPKDTPGEITARDMRKLDELLARGRVQEIREADFADPDITEFPADTDPARQQEAQKARSRRQKEDRKSEKSTKYTDDLGGMDTGARVGQSPYNREREREQYEQGNRFRVTLTMPGFRGSESRVEYFATRGEADAAVAEFEEKENRKRIRRIRSRQKKMRDILSSPEEFEKFYDKEAAKFDEGTSIHTIIAKAFGLKNMMADSLLGEAYVSRHLAEDRVHGAGAEEGGLQAPRKAPSMREVQEAMFLADQEVENAVELLTNREAELVKQLDVYTTDADKDKRDDVVKTLKLVRDYREALIPESKAFMWGDMPHPFFFVDSEGKERVTLGLMAKKSKKTFYYMKDSKTGEFKKQSQSNPQEVLLKFISGGFDKTREGAYGFLKQYDISPEEYNLHLDAALASVQKAQDLQDKPMGYMPVSGNVEIRKDVPGGFQETKGTNYFLYATYLAEKLEYERGKAQFKKEKGKGKGKVNVRPLVSANPEMEELAMFNVAFGKSYEDRGGDYPSRRMYRYFSLLNRTVEEASKQLKAIIERIDNRDYADESQREALVKSAQNLYDYQKKLFPTADEIAQYAEENQYFPKVQGGKLFSEAFSEWMYYDEMLKAIDKYFDYVQNDIAQGFSPAEADIEQFVEERRQEYEAQEQKADEQRNELKYVQKPLFAEFPDLDIGSEFRGETVDEDGGVVTSVYRNLETEVKKRNTKVKRDDVFYVSPEGLVTDYLKVDGYDYREPGQDADDDIDARAGVHSGFKRREVDRGFNVMEELFKKNKSLQSRMTQKIAEVISPNAKKAGYLPKEQVKTKVATQFIGAGGVGSSTNRYEKMYKAEGLANTGEYSASDIIFVSSNGDRKNRIPVMANAKTGELNYVYTNIDKAIEAGASFIMDTYDHLVKTKSYNVGELQAANYIKSKGYKRVGRTGMWTKDGKAKTPVNSIGEIFKSSVPNRYETTFITDFVQPREGVKVKFEYAQDLKEFPSQKVKEVTAIWKTDKFGLGAWYYGKSNKQLETRMTTVGGKSLPTQLGRAVDEAYMIELDRAIIGSDQSLNEVSAAELAEFIFKQGKSAADIARIPSSKNKQDQSGGPGGGLLIFVWEAFIQDAYKRLGIGDFEKKVNVKEYIDPIATDERPVTVEGENLIVQVDENGRAVVYRQGDDSRSAVELNDEAVALLVQEGFGADAKAVAEGLKSEAKGQKLKAPAPAAKKDMSNVEYKNVFISYKAGKFYVDGKLVERSLFAESNKSPDFDYMQATLAPIMQAVIDARRVDIYGTSQGLDKVTPNDPVRREAESQKDGVSEDVPEGMFENTETETDTRKSTVQKDTDQEEGESTVDTIRQSTEELPSTSSFVDTDNNVVVLDTIADRMGASSESARTMRKKLYNLKKGRTKDLKLADVIKLFKNDEVLWKAFDMPQPKGNVMDAKNPFASFEKEIRKHKNFDKFEARILKPGTDSIRAARYVLSSGLPDMYGQLSILNRLVTKAGFDKNDRDKFRKVVKGFDLKTSLIDQADPPKQLVANFLKSAGIKSQELIDAIDVHGLWHQYYGKGYTTVEHSVLEFINPIKDAMAKHGLSNERFGEYLLARAAPSRNMRLLNMYKEELKDYEPGSEKHKALSKMIEERKDDLSGIKTEDAKKVIKLMEEEADIKGFINDASNPLQKFYDMNKEALRLKSQFGLIQTEGEINEYKAMVKAMSLEDINSISSVQMEDNYNYAPMQGFEGETDTLFDNDEAYETVGKSSASSGQGWDQPKYKFLQQGAFGRINTDGRKIVGPDPNSVFATAQSQYYDAAIRSHKNEVSQAFGNLYEIMRAISYPELYEGINSPLTDELKNLDDVSKAEVKKEFDRIFDKDFINEKTEKYYSIEEKDIEVDGEKVEGLKMRRRTLSTEMQNNPYVFIYRTNGEPRFIKFKNNEHGGRMASSMKNLKYEALPRLLQAFNVGTRFLARVFTSLNPAFIIPNFIRDLGTAAIHLSETDKKDLLKGTFSGKRLGGFAKAVFKAEQEIAAGKNQKLNMSIDAQNAEQLLREGDYGKMYQFAKQAGAKIGYFRHKSIPELITDARDIKNPSKKGAMKRLKAVSQYVDSMNTAVENSIRMSAFWSAIEAGRSPQQAATIARNVTVDFNQKGNLTQAFGSLFVFFGASMNSAHRMARTLKNRTPEERIALIGGIVSASFLTAMFNRMLDDDEDDAMPDYDKISTYKRDTNLIIPGANMIPGFEDKFGKDTGFFSIPLPLGYNVFWALGQTAADIFAKTVQGRGGIGPMDFITRNLEANLNAFNPIGGATLQTALIPTAGKPIIEMYANKNFMGSPIRNEDIQFGADKPAHQMDPKRTQEHWTELSRLINSAMGGDEAVKGSIGGLFGGNPLMASANGDYQFDLSGSEMEHLFLGYTGGPGAIANMIFGEGIFPAISKKEYDITVDKMPIANRFVRSTTYGSATRRKYYEIRDAVLVAKSALNKAKASGSSEVALVKNKYGAFLSWEQTMKGVDGRLSKIRDQKAKIEANKSMPHSEKAQRIEELDRKGLNMLTASIKKAQSLGIS